jgi:hypothetical protein
VGDPAEVLFAEHFKSGCFERRRVLLKRRHVCTDRVALVVAVQPAAKGRKYDLIETYKTAREFAADRDAVEATDAESLAGALIGFARGGPMPVAVTSFAGGSRAVVADRLHLLLSDSPLSAASRPWRRIAIAALLVAIAIAGATAPVFAGQHLTCSLNMQAHR